MKILLINNHTQHLSDLTRELAGHEVEMQLYKPGLKFHDEDKDVVILSGGGGEGLEIDDEHLHGKLWYEDQMEYVLSTDKPLLGICMGFEVICRAQGVDVPRMPKLLHEQMNFKTTKKGQSLLGEKQLSQLEAHQWHVTEAPKGFEVLAVSEYGIEIIKKKKVFATQFHPEKTGGTLKLNSLIQNLGFSNSR